MTVVIKCTDKLAKLIDSRCLEKSSYSSVFVQNYLPQIILGDFLLISGVLIGFHTKKFWGKIFLYASYQY